MSLVLIEVAVVYAILIKFMDQKVSLLHEKENLFTMKHIFIHQKSKTRFTLKQTSKANTGRYWNGNENILERILILSRYEQNNDEKEKEKNKKEKDNKYLKKLLENIRK